MKLQYFIPLFLLLSMLVLPGEAQKKTERSYIRSGNRSYNDSIWNKAEIKYRKALDLNPSCNDARYNLGNALYSGLINDSVQGEKPANEVLEEIIKVFNEATQNEQDNARLAQVYHNLGNACYLYGAAQYVNGVQQAKETLAKSIAAYKESLRLNPSDNETRFNLAKAKAIYNSVPSSPQDQNQDQNQEQQQQQDQQDQPQPEPPTERDMSEENAEQILQMLMQDEKDLQEKVQMQQQQTKKLDKDW